MIHKPVPDNVVTPAMSPRERARAFRRRRRERLRVLSVEVREEEVDALVSAGLLRADQSKDRYSILAALYTVLDRAFTALAQGKL
jgi:hypothetical protein